MFVCLCVCICACVRVGGWMCVVYVVCVVYVLVSTGVCTCVWRYLCMNRFVTVKARDWHWGCHLHHFPPLFFRTESLSEPEAHGFILAGWPISLSNPPVSAIHHHQHWSHKHIRPCPAFCVGSECPNSSFHYFMAHTITAQSSSWPSLAIFIPLISMSI